MAGVIYTGLANRAAHAGANLTPGVELLLTDYSARLVGQQAGAAQVVAVQIAHRAGSAVPLGNDLATESVEDAGRSTATATIFFPQAARKVGRRYAASSAG